MGEFMVDRFQRWINIAIMIGVLRTGGAALFGVFIIVTTTDIRDAAAAKSQAGNSSDLAFYVSVGFEQRKDSKTSYCSKIECEALIAGQPAYFNCVEELHWTFGDGIVVDPKRVECRIPDAR